MADAWISLGVSLVGLSGLYVLLRPMAGADSRPIVRRSGLHAATFTRSIDRTVITQSVKAQEEPKE